MWAHQVRSERAVQPDREGLGVRKSIPKCFHFLRGNHRFTTQSDRSRDDHRETHSVFRIYLLHRHCGGFGIEGIENRFDHQDIAPAFDQAPDLMFVGSEHLIESHHPEAGVVGVRGIR